MRPGGAGTGSAASARAGESQRETSAPKTALVPSAEERAAVDRSVAWSSRPAGQWLRTNSLELSSVQRMSSKARTRGVLARRGAAVLEAARAGRAASLAALGRLAACGAAGAGRVEGASGGAATASAMNCCPPRHLVGRREALESVRRYSASIFDASSPGAASTSASALPGSTRAPVPTTLPLSSCQGLRDGALEVALVALLVDVEEEPVALLHPEADLVEVEPPGGAHDRVEPRRARRARVEQLVGPEGRDAEALPELRLRIDLRRRGVERRRRQRRTPRVPTMTRTRCFDVVAARHEVGGEGVEQRGRGGRVGRPQVVDGIDEAAARGSAPTCG